MTEPQPTPPEPEMVGAADASVYLAGGTQSVEVPIDTRALRSAVAAGPQARLYLSLEHVDADSTPAQAYTVSVESTGKDAGRELVGTLALFGIEKLHEARGDDGPHHQRLVYDVTDVAERLGGPEAMGLLRVVFEEVTFEPPEGAAGLAPTDVAEIVPIRVGRITLRRG